MHTPTLCLHIRRLSSQYAVSFVSQSFSCRRSSPAGARRQQRQDTTFASHNDAPSFSSTNLPSGWQAQVQTLLPPRVPQSVIQPALFTARDATGQRPNASDLPHLLTFASNHCALIPRTLPPRQSSIQHGREALRHRSRGPGRHVNATMVR